MRPAVFLDRDGTLIRNVHHGADPLTGEVLDGAVIALRAWRRFDYRLVVVTNQSGIGRGLFSTQEARQAARYLCAWLGWQGVGLDGYYFCPHRPVESPSAMCDCRKPQPGMLLAAADALAIDLARSWMIGDMLADCLAGGAAGCRSILLTGETEGGGVRPRADGESLVARNLPHAAALVLAMDGHLDSLPLPTRPGGGARSRPQAPLAVGEASPWPDGPIIEQARRDAGWLADHIERSGRRRDHPSRQHE